MSPTPLPPIASGKFQGSGLHEEPNAVAAYEKILKAEAQAIQGGTEEDLINVRVLGYSILEFYASRAVLGDKAFRMIIDDVMRSSQDREGGEDDHSFVFEVGRKYRGVIDAFSKPIAQHSQLSSHQFLLANLMFGDVIKE